MRERVHSGGIHIILLGVKRHLCVCVYGWVDVFVCRTLCLCKYRPHFTSLNKLYSSPMHISALSTGPVYHSLQCDKSLERCHGPKGEYVCECILYVYVCGRVLACVYASVCLCVRLLAYVCVCVCLRVCLCMCMGV